MDEEENKVIDVSLEDIDDGSSDEGAGFHPDEAKEKQILDQFKSKDPLE